MDRKRRPPRIFESKVQCCGCSCCAHSCPVNAIVMASDLEGFLYPSINEKLCISCYKCEQVCIYLSNK